MTDRVALACAALACAALAGCSGGSTGSSASAGGTPGSASGSAPGPSAGATASPTSVAATTTAPGVTTAVPTGAPVLPSRKGSPPIPWDTAAARNAPGVTAIPSAASGPAHLTIVLDDGSGIRSTWTLRCDPAGGNHPDPARACGVLGANGAKALPPTPADRACTQIYGGPQKALVEGTWRGKPVKSRFSLENGCETTRWTLMLGLLPPGGVP